MARAKQKLAHREAKRNGGFGNPRSPEPRRGGTILLCRRLKITPTSAKAALLGDPDRRLGISYNSLPSIPRPTTPTSTTPVLVGDPGKALHAGLSCFRPAERDWCTGESGSYAASMNALILPKALRRSCVDWAGSVEQSVAVSHPVRKGGGQGWGTIIAIVITSEARDLLLSVHRKADSSRQNRALVMTIQDGLSALG